MPKGAPPQPLQPPVIQTPPPAASQYGGEPQDPMSRSKINNNLKIALIVALVLVTAGLLSAVLFFDNIKSMPSGSPYPTLDPSVTCARFTDVNHALRNVDKACILDLSGMDLSSLPADISKLTRLNVVILSDNEFTEFPEGLTEVSSLIEIDLANNKISRIPDSISKLNKLQVLNLSGNDISSVPQSLLEIKTLVNLDLSGNEINEADLEKAEAAFQETAPEDQ